MTHTHDDLEAPTLLQPGCKVLKHIHQFKKKDHPHSRKIMLFPAPLNGVRIGYQQVDKHTAISYTLNLKRNTIKTDP